MITAKQHSYSPLPTHRSWSFTISPFRPQVSSNASDYLQQLLLTVVFDLEVRTDTNTHRQMIDKTQGEKGFKIKQKTAELIVTHS